MSEEPTMNTLVPFEPSSDASTQDSQLLSPDALKSIGFQFSLETPESCKAMYERVGRFCTDSHVGAELEELVQEAFVEGYFKSSDNPKKDMMYCLSIRDIRNDYFPTGVIFWREMEAKEMKNWMPPETAQKLRAYYRGEAELEQEMLQAARSIAHDVQLSSPASSSSSSESLLPMPSSSPFSSSSSSSAHAAASGALTLADTAVRTVPHGISSPLNVYAKWVKIELVSTHPHYFGRRVGTLLMLGAMMMAHARHQERCVLHVSGGKQNIPAVRLYEKLGFQPVSADHFHLPNNNMYMLLNITQSLMRTDWTELNAYLRKLAQGQGPAQQIETTPGTTATTTYGEAETSEAEKGSLASTPPPLLMHMPSTTVTTTPTTTSTSPTLTSVSAAGGDKGTDAAAVLR